MYVYETIIKLLGSDRPLTGTELSVRDEVGQKKKEEEAQE